MCAVHAEWCAAHCDGIVTHFVPTIMLHTHGGRVRLHAPDDMHAHTRVWPVGRFFDEPLPVRQPRLLLLLRPMRLCMYKPAVLPPPSPQALLS